MCFSQTQKCCDSKTFTVAQNMSCRPVSVATGSWGDKPFELAALVNKRQLFDVPTEADARVRFVDPTRVGVGGCNSKAVSFCVKGTEKHSETFWKKRSPWRGVMLGCFIRGPSSSEVLPPQVACSRRRGEPESSPDLIDIPNAATHAVSRISQGTIRNWKCLYLDFEALRLQGEPYSGGRRCLQTVREGIDLELSGTRPLRIPETARACPRGLQAPASALSDRLQ
jgi:hypothetical protein